MSDELLVVGAPAANSYAGLVYIYTPSSSSSSTPYPPSSAEDWNLHTTLTAPVTGPVAFQFFGFIIHFSDPLSMLAITEYWAASGSSSAAGLVHLYNVSNPTSVEYIDSLASSQPLPGSDVSAFGESFTFSEHGTIIVGAPYEETSSLVSAGASYVFTDTSPFTELQRLTAPTPGTNALCGSALATSGPYLAMGCPREQDEGFVHIGLWDGSSGYNWINALSSPVPDQDDSFGYSILFSPSHLLIGAPRQVVAEGRIWRFNPSNLAQNGTALTHPAPQTDERVGHRLALYGDTLLSTAIRYTDAETFQGRVVHWIWSNDQWTWASYLNTPSPGPQSYYGNSLAFTNETRVLIGDALETLHFVSIAAVACGDGLVGDGEQCDDGNFNDGDGCSFICETEFCGDSLINNVNETCDDGNAITELCPYNPTPDTCTICNSICQEVIVLPEGYCGDVVVQGTFEQCDDGNSVAGDGCSSACVAEFCGDSIINNVNETCDDGNAITESCPYSASPGDCNICDATCQSITVAPDGFCGDGLIQGTFEECDDGNNDSDDGCSSTCVIEFCGDGIINGGNETCDDGNVVTENCPYNTLPDTCPICNATCQLVIVLPDNFCGDGVTNAGFETCDDGNAVSDDGCTSTCQAEFCGDGVVNNNGTETCDDGNSITEPCSYSLVNTTCAVCNSECQDVVVPVVNFCGDGIIYPSEACDDGNSVSGDGCTSTCQTEVCGDGVINNNGTEQCDDGNDYRDGCEYGVFCTVCDETCSWALGIIPGCGDGDLQLAFEECDDGNLVDGDGCDASCTLELCGNGIVQVGEDCDPPEADVCDAFCKDWAFTIVPDIDGSTDENAGNPLSDPLIQSALLGALLSFFCLFVVLASRPTPTIDDAVLANPVIGVDNDPPPYEAAHATIAPLAPPPPSSELGEDSGSATNPTRRFSTDSSLTASATDSDSDHEDVYI